MSDLSGGIDTSLRWSELEDKKLVVVLGEAGSGKTWEFRARAREARVSGKAAFFLRLEWLINGTLDDAVEAECQPHLRKWLRGKESATFYLDSVDEAKFRLDTDFYRAVSRFAKELGPERLARSTVLLSSRVTKWQHDIDEPELCRHLEPCLRPLGQQANPEAEAPSNSTEVKSVRASGSHETADSHNSPLIVRLLPLDRNRVDIYTRAKTDEDPIKFLQELDSKHAWEFARRPLDVDGLLAYWGKHHRLGTLSEIIAYDLELKIRPADRDAHDPLSVSKAMEGAKSMGAAVALCKSFEFRIPGSETSRHGALETSTLLPGAWRSEEISALFTRPVFDGASFGSIRFHHRRVAEYLAAQWLIDCMQANLTKVELKGLLFDQTGQNAVLRPSLAPIAAWLCTGDREWQYDVREWVLQCAPEIHLLHGDPESLSVDYKRRLLKKLRSCREERSWFDVEDESLSRLACADIAEDIAAIIRDRSVSQDVRIAMIEAARLGRLKSCEREILGVIESGSDADGVVAHALNAIREIGSTESRHRIATLALSTQKISSRLFGNIISATYPDTLSGKQLVSLLKSFTSAVHRTDTGMYITRSHLEKSTPPDEAAELLAGFLPIGRQHGDCSESLPFAPGFDWISQVLPPVVKSLLSKSTLTNSEVSVTTEVLDVLGRFERQTGLLGREETESLSKSTESQPAVRRELFWREVGSARKRYQQEPKPGSLFQFGKLLRLDPCDIEWLAAEVGGSEPFENQKLALECACYVAFSVKTQRSVRSIAKAVGDDSRLRSIYWRLRLQSKFRLVGDIRQRIKQTIGQRWWWIGKQRQLRNLRDRWRNKRALRRALPKLRLGKDTYRLSLLALEAKRSGSSSRWAPDSWENLRRMYGSRICRAAKEGCKRAWRSMDFEPLLPHEKPDSSSTDRRVIVGLAGLRAATLDGDLDFTRLPDEEAELATRFAVNELNDFPPWLPLLAESSEGAVSRVLCECVSGEWKYPAEHGSVQHVLARLARESKFFLPDVETRVWDLLKAGDPLHTEILGLALALVVNSSQTDRRDLAGLAEKRLKSLAAGNARHQLWLLTLVQVDAPRAFEVIEKRIRPAKLGKNVVTNLCGTLSGRSSYHIPLARKPDFLSAANLHRFVVIAFRYMPPKDDLERPNGVAYNHTARDEAPHFRAALLDRLASSEDQGANGLQQSLLDEPVLACHHAWIAHLLRERAKRHADHSRLDESELQRFAESATMTPISDKELFELGAKRLVEIKDDVEWAENSCRSEMNEKHDERELRKWFRRKLRSRANDQYNVPEEVEIDLEQRPDLRFERPDVDPVSTEVKLAENWAFSVLIERLENQLVGQYLRAHNNRYGIYLLGLVSPTKKARWRDPESGKLVNFAQVLEILQVRARILAESDPRVEGLEVIGVDFRHPAKKKAAKKKAAKKKAAKKKATKKKATKKRAAKNP